MQHRSAHFLPDLIAEQARKTPDRVAVATRDGGVSYGELLARADSLAGFLRERGAGPDALVGIHAHRSPEMLVAVLGVLRAGAAYVPLDPAHPAERLRRIAGDARLTAIVCTAAARPTLPPVDVPVHDDADWEGHAPAPDRSPAGEDLAYVIHTSGSTGRPKGVMITHANLAWSTAARAAWYGEPVRRFLLLSSFAFDSSVAGIFWTLSQGGTLWLPPEGGERDVGELVATIRRERITHLLCLPSLYALLLAHAGRGALASLRAAIVAGEACPQRVLDDHARLVPGAGFYNEYGPTEATVWATVHGSRPGAHTGALRGTVPIGHAIDGARVTIVDARGEPAPDGERGEIHVGGPGVARGYLGDPALTSDRFVAGPDDAGRVYRTGDFARRLADGQIEFLGRADDQVKINGVRVELAEVDTVLRAQPEVDEAVAGTRDDGPDASLVAYLVLRAGVDAGAVARVQAAVALALPAPMVPTTFVVLETLPRTATGKVDRRALTTPTFTPVVARDRSDALQRFVGRLWDDALGRPTRLDDDFFASGGTSLGAMRLMAAVERKLGRRLPLAALLAAPTPRRFIAALRASPGERREESPVVAVRRGDGPPLFVLPGIGGHALMYLPLARHLRTEHAIYGLQPPGLDGRTTPIEDVRELAGLYLRHVRALQPEGPYAIAGFSFGGTVAWEMARRLGAAGETVGTLALFDTPSRVSARSRVRGAGKRLASMVRSIGEPPAASDDDGHHAHFYAMDGHLPEAFTAVRDASARALRRYRPGPYDGHVTVLRAADDQATAWTARTTGWESLAASVAVHDVAGTHNTMLEEPHVETVATLLAAALAATDVSRRRPAAATFEALRRSRRA